jgi:hypothetical protein
MSSKKMKFNDNNKNHKNIHIINKFMSMYGIYYYNSCASCVNVSTLAFCSTEQNVYNIINKYFHNFNSDIKWSIKCDSHSDKNGQYIIWVNKYTMNNLIEHDDGYMQPNKSFDISDKIDNLNQKNENIT